MQLIVRSPEPSTVPTPPRTFASNLRPGAIARVLDPCFKSPSASAWSLSRSKRFLDVAVAVLVLSLLALPMVAIAICVRLSSKGPILYAQNRVGRGGRVFAIYKFRSMVACSATGPGLTGEGDERITPCGRWLRKFKLDELPQFYNILQGSMSLIGPRPKSPQYVAIENMPYRPGITGAATLAFRREEQILADIHPSQLDAFYAQRIKPLKARIDVRYMNRATFSTDIRLIAATFLACVSASKGRPALRDREEFVHKDRQTSAQVQVPDSV